MLGNTSSPRAQTRKDAQRWASHPNTSEKPLWSLSPQERTEAAQLAWRVPTGVYTKHREGHRTVWGATPSHKMVKLSWAEENTSSTEHKSHKAEINWPASCARSKALPTSEAPLWWTDGSVPAPILALSFPIWAGAGWDAGHPSPHSYHCGAQGQLGLHLLIRSEQHGNSQGYLT